MFDIRLVRNGDSVTFDRHLPIFNWQYPFNAENRFTADVTRAYRIPATAPRRRAVYIHIPFCQTICSFCPFSRDVFRSEDELDVYLDALIAEMQMKRTLLGRFRVDAMFIGGGTPSLLNPRQMERLGEAVAEHFDLDALTEFTCEIEVKSIDERKVAILRDIGVNRISFGVQTFSKRYRSLFRLDASIDQIIDASAMLNGSFGYTNCDLLYGMAGQTRDEVQEDLLSITSLNTTSVDIYPINNLSASNGMHRSIRESSQHYLSAAERVRFRALLERALRDMGYAPISGYGFARAEKINTCADDPVQHSPKFLYHDLVYGHHDDEIIGYGSSALSRLRDYNVHNFSNRARYVRALLGERRLPQLCFGEIASPERGIVSFPFRGELKKAKVPWNFVPEDTLIALQDLVEAKLVVDKGDTYVLSHLGWLFYVNAMFYLMPRAGKEWISRKIEQSESRGRRCGDPSLADFQPLLQETTS
jgi:coproporphyrinogen III oxidase-like Fe-S oxidoreductase